MNTFGCATPKTDSILNFVIYNSQSMDFSYRNNWHTTPGLLYIWATNAINTVSKNRTNMLKLEEKFKRGKLHSGHKMIC